MEKIILLNKKEGETPLEALELFRRKHREYKDVPMTYAGRLDPMASGLLIILAGEECKKKEKYLALPKEYEFEILFGFATDTYDILGKMQHKGHTDKLEYVGMLELEKKIKESLKYFRGKITQTYPAYSSRTVKGKPLFAYARAGEEVELPEREVMVKKLEFLKLRKISAGKLLVNIEKRIKKVQGDFRQKEILKIWKGELRRKKSERFFAASFRISCSSGTYVRTIANDLGTKMGIPALAFSIRRTKLGKWKEIL